MLIFWDRTAAFSYFSAAAVTAGFVGSPLAYLAMRRGPWFSVAVGFGMFVLSFFLTFTLSSSRNEAAEISSRRNSQVEEPTLTVPLSKGTRAGRFMAVIRDQFLLNRTLGTLLCSLFIIHLGRSSTSVLKQYVTRRYEWSWSEVRRKCWARCGTTWRLHCAMPFEYPCGSERNLESLC